MSNTALLQISKKLCFGYPQGFQGILNDELSWNNNNIIILLGLNGSGKSTFLQTISSFLPTIRGDIKIQNQSIYKMSPKEIATHLSFVDFDLPLKQYFTVMEYFHLCLYSKTNLIGNLSNDWIENIYQIAYHHQIHSFLDEPLQQLSSGERQKIFFIGSILKKPNLLFLDEPTTYLDFKQKKKLQELIFSIKPSCLSFISTHDLNFAWELGDYFLIFHEKQVNLYKKKDLSFQDIPSFF